MAFSPNTRSRCWVVVVHIQNMINVGLTKEQYEQPEFLAMHFISLWEQSGTGRKAGAAVCISATGVYHMHLAVYGNTTTLSCVSKILGNAHVEPQLGSKAELTAYLNKEGKYAEKGEQVLYTQGLDVIEDKHGNRNDLDEIEQLLKDGLTPEQIFEESFRYRRFEKMIKSEYLARRIRETPLKKVVYAEWHCGESGSGKSYTYFTLCEQYGAENVYITSDFDNGGFDLYIDQGAPDILFLDEFKGNMPFSKLLAILDEMSKNQTHCRYGNAYNLWTKCYITSIFPPEEAYDFMVEHSVRNRDKLVQLLRRLNLIVYHYKTDAGEYKTFSIPGTEYINYEDLKRRAFADKDGFVPLEKHIENFQETQEELDFLLPPK